MITIPDNVWCSSPELVHWVAKNCVVLPSHTRGSLETVSAWCEQRGGVSRPGNILQEAEDGWIDRISGDWQIALNPFSLREEMVIWFAHRELLTEFCLTWT